MGYVRTVVRRQIAAHIQVVIERRRNQMVLDPSGPFRDRRPSPEHALAERQTVEVALRVLRSIPERDREVLIRFYLDEQTPRQICGDLKLTETQFRLIKSRAKARFGELGKRTLTRRKSTRARPM
jgi:DNA-directed RNA polymerase specialized sigma24 family protein